jgi:hypothetical protein
MTIPSNPLALAGNTAQVDAVTLTYDAMTNVATPAATQASVCAGTGAPTFSATKGTLYVNLTGSSTATRLYVNTNGSTTWTNFTSAA